MTLDEAIKHAEEVMSEMSYEFQESVALQDHENAKLCRECAEEHRQLAEWLKDYKRLLEQEPKTGHWIDCEDLGDDGIEYWCECSECHSERAYKTNFCPDCGAKMKEGD